MKIRFGNVLLTAIAMVAGIVTLLGYFLGSTVPMLFYLRALLVSWVVFLGAVAVCLGALNLGSVHLRKIFQQERGWPYSLSVLFGLLIGLSAGFVPPLIAFAAGLRGAPAAEASGPGNAVSQWVFHYLQSALGTAISGLIVFFLVFAGFRLLRRPTWRLTSVVFIIVAILSLIGMAPFFNLNIADLPVMGHFTLNEVRAWPWAWLSQVPAVAGARGLLLGIALGAIATGLRVLLALDRPYGE